MREIDTKKRATSRLELTEAEQIARIKAYGLTPVQLAPSWDDLEKQMGPWQGLEWYQAECGRIADAESQKRYGTLDIKGRCWKVQNPAIVRGQSNARRSPIRWAKAELCSETEIAIDVGATESSFSESRFEF